MSYKFKPNKSVAKRFRVTGTGKLKRGKTFHSHLMSARDAKHRRNINRPAILAEGHARNMRWQMGISGRRPLKIAHMRALALRAATAIGTESKTETTPV